MKLIMYTFLLLAVFIVSHSCAEDKSHINNNNIGLSDNEVPKTTNMNALQKERKIQKIKSKKHEFTFNGEKLYIDNTFGDRYSEYLLSLIGDSKSAQKGDVICIAGSYIIVGEEKRYDFFTFDDKPGELYVRKKMGDLKLIAITIYERELHIDNDYKYELVNPLSKLSKKEIRELRGVRICISINNILQKLKDINFDNTCFEIDGKIIDKMSVFANIKYLIISNLTNPI